MHVGGSLRWHKAIVLRLERHDLGLLSCSHLVHSLDQLGEVLLLGWHLLCPRRTTTVRLLLGLVRLTFRRVCFTVGIERRALLLLPHLVQIVPGHIPKRAVTHLLVAVVGGHRTLFTLLARLLLVGVLLLLMVILGASFVV